MFIALTSKAKVKVTESRDLNCRPLLILPDMVSEIRRSEPIRTPFDGIAALRRIKPLQSRDLSKPLVGSLLR